MFRAVITITGSSSIIRLNKVTSLPNRVKLSIYTAIYSETKTINQGKRSVFSFSLKMKTKARIAPKILSKPPTVAPSIKKFIANSEAPNNCIVITAFWLLPW